jgi:uncharacterized protein involved in tolerance to divalent cations
MVNVVIYTDKISVARNLVALLLKNELVANASIDKNNTIYRLANKKVIKKTNIVITTQTKSLLFSHIEKLIKDKYGDQIPIYSVPITQANHSFDVLIRSNTKKI